MRFTYKHPTVEARQFNGGVEAAKEFVQWAESKGCQAWMDPGIIRVDPATGDSTAGVVVEMDLSPEGGQFDVSLQVVVGMDDWLVWDQDHFRTYGNIHFRKHFDKPKPKPITKPATKPVSKASKTSSK